MEEKKEKWFLGGTCAETTWRNELMPLQAIEEDEKNSKCNVHLYVITPEMQGVYSIAEIVHSAHLANTYGTSVDKVIFAVLDDPRWDKKQSKSLDATMKMIDNIARDHAVCGYVADMNELMELCGY